MPADAVKVVWLGAAYSAREGWPGALYIAFGPRRSPGLVKPDVLESDGSSSEHFIVFDCIAPGRVACTSGTYFASPAARRRDVAIRAHFGARLAMQGVARCRCGQLGTVVLTAPRSARVASLGIWGILRSAAVARFS